MSDTAKPAKKKMDRARLKAILADAGQILWRSRRRLVLGIPLILINRLSGFVLPATPKYIIDDVINKGRHELLPWIVAAAAVAAALGSITDYALAQILGMAAQRSITQLRMKIQQHVQRLPVRYFDSTKTGVLVSRVMNDAEGIRNLVGTGLLQMFGGLLTAVLAIGVLFYLSAKLAALILVLSSVFIVALVWAFTTARPLFKGADLAEQRRKLIQALAMVVQGLDHLEALSGPAPCALRRHGQPLRHCRRGLGLDA